MVALNSGVHVVLSTFRIDVIESSFEWTALRHDKLVEALMFAAHGARHAVGSRRVESWHRLHTRKHTEHG